MSDKEIGFCNKCQRCTWNYEEIGKKCKMIQPDGFKCDGIFVKNNHINLDLITKIKSVLNEINNCDETMLWMQNSKGEEYEAKVITRKDFCSLIKAFEIAVDYIQDNYNDPAAQKASNQIAEILEVKP